MHKRVLPYYFVFSLAIGSLIYLAQKLAIELPVIVNNYVNDFLIIPIVLIVSLYVLRWSRNDANYQISIGAILYLCSFYAVIFEYVLPKFHPRYTADIIDVVLYFMGGIIFYYLQKHSV